MGKRLELALNTETIEMAREHLKSFSRAEKSENLELKLPGACENGCHEADLHNQGPGPWRNWAAPALPVGV